MEMPESNSPLADQSDRDEFCKEIDRNFSVIAPAGVGKTTAIVHRIVNIALKDPERLPRLVVVTYTKKAADEMQLRARSEIAKHGAGNILSRFNQAFFGTIHSYCLYLISKYGSHFGIPGQLELLENDDELWLSYVRQKDRWVDFLPLDIKEPFLKFASLSHLLKYARCGIGGEESTKQYPAFPEIDMNGILGFEANARNKVKIEEGKRIVDKWLNDYESGATTLSIPDYAYGGKDFQAAWQSAFAPFKQWLSEIGSAFIQEIAKDYLQYRLKKQMIKYDDMIHLAGMILKEPNVLVKIQAMESIVILDEAQDTDAAQFDIFLKIAGFEDVYLKGTNNGRFCMVGDPQQSIYSSRADLPTYIRIHKSMTNLGSASALKFSVTMRCDRRVVDNANQVFPKVLSDAIRAGQIEFSPLTARPWAGEGDVIKLKLTRETTFEKDDQAVEWEAAQVAKFLAIKEKKALGIDDWKEVAILAPRNKWLVPFANALQAAGLKCQVHSKNDILGDNPAYAWLTALMLVANNPDDGFELAGILREIYGISDHEIAVYVRAGNPLQISQPNDKTGCVADVLNQLHKIYAASKTLSLRGFAQYWIEATGLRERLNLLPEYIGLNDTLSDLLLSASEAEEKGFHVGMWVKDLTKKYTQTAGEIAPLPDHIQLYSCHKAKGLEWNIVILPCLFRPLREPRAEYPRMIERAGEAVFILDSSQLTDEDKDYQINKKHAEYERLLYVAMTRPREKLILVDDESLFRKSENSFADFLGILSEGANRKYWDQMPQNLSSVEKKIGQKPVESPEWISRMPDLEPQKLVIGKVNARAYCARYTPSSLASHDREFYDDKDKLTSNIGIDYGNWWHHVMEKAPWGEGKPALAAYLKTNLSQCPLPDRGEKEMDVLIASDLLTVLSGQAWLIVTEVPFLWKKDSKTAIEGIIDFLAFGKEEAQWLLLDWKTDFIEAGDSPEAILREHYAPQINLYAEALRSIYQISGSSYIYSTHKGKLIEL